MYFCTSIKVGSSPRKEKVLLRKVCRGKYVYRKRRFKVALKKEDWRNNYIMRSCIIFTPTNIRKAIQLRNMRYEEWGSSDKSLNCLTFMVTK